MPEQEQEFGSRRDRRDAAGSGVPVSRSHRAPAGSGRRRVLVAGAVGVLALGVATVGVQVLSSDEPSRAVAPGEAPAGLLPPQTVPKPVSETGPTLVPAAAAKPVRAGARPVPAATAQPNPDDTSGADKALAFKGSGDSVPVASEADVSYAARPAVAVKKTVPNRLNLLGRSLSVVPERVTKTEVQVPTSAWRVGLLGSTAALSAPTGSTTIAAHVALGRYAGAFASLHTLRVGSGVETVDKDGVTAQWRVESSRAYPKGGLPAEVFSKAAPAGQRVLYLVTCDGPIRAGVPGAHGQRVTARANNLVVRLVLVGGGQS